MTKFKKVKPAATKQTAVKEKPTFARPPPMPGPAMAPKPKMAPILDKLCALAVIHEVNDEGFTDANS